MKNSDRTLEDFRGERVYIESNILIYNALAHPEYGDSCRRFLERGLRKEFEILTSGLTIDEIAFIAFKTKVEEEHPRENVVRFLKNNPDVVKSLSAEVNMIIDNVLTIATIVDVTKLDIGYMQRFMEEFGLLPRDAIHLAVTHNLGISSFASNDSDFERVDWLKPYKPSKS